MKCKQNCWNLKIWEEGWWMWKKKIYNFGAIAHEVIMCILGVFYLKVGKIYSKQWQCVNLAIWAYVTKKLVWKSYHSSYLCGL